MDFEQSARRFLRSILAGSREASSYMEISSHARDPNKNGIGTSFNNDAGGTFLPIPRAPSTSNENRYLIRLCGWPIPPGRSARVQSLAQYVEIGDFLPLPNQGGVYPLRRQVFAPNWSFTDGDVLFGLRVMPTPYYQQMIVDPLQPEGYSTNINGTSSGILYLPNKPGGGPVPYAPLNGGIFPGSPVGDLGMIHDLRSVWGQNKMYFNYTVDGPSQIVFYASVKQTDPATRVNIPQGAPAPGLPVEDLFVQSYPNAIYTRVGGSFTMEIGPSLRTASFRDFHPDGPLGDQ
jgi:hypothetical protein